MLDYKNYRRYEKGDTVFYNKEDYRKGLMPEYSIVIGFGNHCLILQDGEEVDYFFCL